jgi:Uma2 family endonuclease
MIGEQEMVSAIKPRYVTPEEYLEAERKAEFKSEYFCGEIVAMSGSSPRHGTITVNVTGEFRSQLKGTPCQAFSNDVKIRTLPNGLFAYPDLSVVCGELEYHDDRRDVITNPRVIVEVLSPSTESVDRGRKWMQYQQIASLTAYLLISQEQPYIEHYARQADQQWLLTIATGMDASLTLASIGCTLSPSEVYDRVRWDVPDTDLVEH